MEDLRNRRETAIWKRKKMCIRDRKYKVIVTYNDLKAKEIYEEYRFYDRNVMLYPAKDLIRCV